MYDFVGLIGRLEFRRVSLKRLALMFQQVGIPGAERERETEELFFGRGHHSPALDELEWLIDQGIVIDPDAKFANSNFITSSDDEKQVAKKLKNLERQYNNLLEFIRHSSNKNKKESKASGRKKLSRSKRIIKPKEITVEVVTDEYEKMRMTILAALQKDYQKIRLSIVLRDLYHFNAFPVTSPFIFLPLTNPIVVPDVVQIALLKIPMPDDSTPWEHILEYRSDPDTQAKFLDLRAWMNELARAKLTPIEIEQKLEHLMSQYQRHMRVHKMKTNAGRLETCLTISTEFLEELIHFRPSKAVKALFSLKHRKIALLEAELTVPGREVAYLIKAQDTFK